MLQFDNDLFLRLNAGPTPDATIVALAIFATHFLILLIPFFLGGLWVFGGQRNRLTSIALCVALGVAIMMSSTVGLLIVRPRPFMVGLGHALVEHRANSSFPSNHGLAFAVCAAVLFMVRRRQAAWIACAAGLIVAWSRIYVGVHYPLDMVGSVVVAIPAAMASLRIMDRHGAQVLKLAERVESLILGRFNNKA
ncbi:undecaprenyl-diphosphatase [Microvirga sp. M2]|uniref:undecaprenyl-diphosphatase n=1 Tax=Microvirga sp. M2 TaxID=3073270 RepID=UPI0039C3F048